MKQFLQVLMTMIVDARAQIVTGGDANSAIIRLLPDAVRALSELQAETELRRKAYFIASHAVQLLHTTIETSEDDSGMRDVAKRAVRLVEMTLEEAERRVLK